MRNINNSDNRINVDSKNYSTIARFRQEDDATLVVNLYKNGEEFDVSNQTITLRALRVDGQSINQTDNITKNKNIVTINFRRNILNVIGRCSIQLNISDASGQFTTAEFFVEVEKNNLGADALKGSDNVQALQQILIDFKAEKSSLIKNITDDYNSLKKIIISQNQAAELQNQINANKQQSVENTNRIEQLEDLTPVWQEQVGTGFVTVNDSFDGVTKDLVIKGLTLKNLLENKVYRFSTGLPSSDYVVDSKDHSIKITISSNETTWRYISLGSVKAASISAGKTYSIICKSTGLTNITINDTNGANNITKSSKKVNDNLFIINIADNATIENQVFYCRPTTTDKILAISDVIILEGDWSNKEIPTTYFDSITSAGELEDNKIIIKSVGKNLFSSELELGSLSVDGSLVTDNRSIRSKHFMLIKENTKYHISNSNNYQNNCYFYDSNFNFISSTANNAISTPANSKYIKVRTSVGLNQNDLSTLFQLEEGTKATNYEQYRAKLIEIPLPFQKGLKSTLDGAIFDEINGNTGEIIQRVSDEYTALAKPVIHKITDVQLSTFDETTHITQENNILSDISFKAKVSLSSQSKRLSEENKALKEENRELREDTNTIVDSLISVFEPMLLPYDDNAEEEQKIILEKLYAIKNR